MRKSWENCDLSKKHGDIMIFIWVNYVLTSLQPHWEIMVKKGKSSPNGLNLGLVNYYDLPSLLCMMYICSVYAYMYVFH